MAKPKHKPPTSRWASEAAQQALLRFGPQLDALTQIQKEAESAYGVGVAQARGNADATVATIDRARPDVGAIYDRAGLEQARSASVVNNNIASLPGLSPDLQAAIGLEQQNAVSRVSSGRAQAQTGLVQQRVAAKAGAQFGAQKAHDDLVSTLSKIFDQRASLESQAGTFQSLTAQQLQDKATSRADTLASQQAGRDVTTRGQDLSHGDRVASLAARNAKASKPKLVPAGAHATARKAVATAIETFKQLDPDRTDRHHVAPELVTGAPAVKAQAIHDPKTGKPVLNPDGTAKTTGDLPAIPGVGEWATIAADVYYDGHLSRANARKLHAQHYSVKQLGLPTYTEWRKTHDPVAERKKKAVKRAAGAAGNLASGVF